MAGHAVDAGAGGVDEGRAAVEGPVKEFLGESIIVVHHVAAVGLGGVGAALVVEGGGVEAGGTSADEVAEFGVVHVVGDVAIAEVAELVSEFEVIDGEDVGDAAVVEGADEVAADEAGGSGDDVHGRETSSRKWGNPVGFPQTGAAWGVTTGVG